VSLVKLVNGTYLDTTGSGSKLKDTKSRYLKQVQYRTLEQWALCKLCPERGEKKQKDWGS
jgi:hypothetical protein